ncbi:MAG: hypothetical protein EZS28_017597 [Streblomastix strix]|uniref:Uncharacterized protein n=1 Tax=Streblomastix strix TaxID=222440 RepID=A0A5J4VXH9_9EUKA|nr:MAG: hypothetical protein EZS28_017597 [Streblomastix strix]
MAYFNKENDKRKDVFYLETLALPSEIHSMVVGRFFNKNVDTLILAKSTFLSIFQNNEEEDSFDFVDHICVYKEVYCLCTSVQPHSLDCLFVLSNGGEWLFLQWNKTRFFPLATGSLLKAIQPLMKTPEQRRFRLDPTFQWAVSVVPITDNSPRFFTRPAPKQDQKTIPGQNKPIVRISFRAVIVVDETVFVGVKYDGPDAKYLSIIKAKWFSALKQFPIKFGYVNSNYNYEKQEENMNTTIRNGLEKEWKIQQIYEQNKKDLCIANADTFIFFEDDEDQPKYVQNALKKKKQFTPPTYKENFISMFESINRVRHLSFTTSMRLMPFPIRKKPFIMPSFQFNDPLNRERDGEVAGPGLSEIQNQGRIQLPEYQTSNVSCQSSTSKLQNSELQIDDSKQCCTTAIALVDQPVGINAINLLFDFKHHRISLHSFAIAALPPSSSRIMPMIDENRVMKILKGLIIKPFHCVHAGDANIVKGAFSKTNDYLKDYFTK